jgi:hypothetical protein
MAEPIRRMGLTWYQWATLIMLMLGTLIDGGSRVYDIVHPQQPASDVQVDALLRRVIELQEQAQAPHEHVKQQHPRPGPSDPCWCGSGTRFSPANALIRLN